MKSYENAVFLLKYLSEEKRHNKAEFCQLKEKKHPAASRWTAVLIDLIICGALCWFTW